MAVRRITREELEAANAGGQEQLPPELGTDPAEQTYEPSLPQLDYEGQALGTQAPPADVQQAVADAPANTTAQAQRPRKATVRRIVPEKEPGTAARATHRPTSNEGWLENIGAAANSIADGLLWGWTDEIGSVVGASFAAMRGEDFGDFYESKLNALQAERDAFAKEHPYIDFAGNLAGGILGGGPAAMAYKAAGKIGSTAGRIGARTGAFAGEGAVAGAGSSKEGERGTGAAQGAILTAGLGNVMSGIGAGANAVTRRNVEQDLVDKAGRFTPINQAGDPSSKLQPFYHKLVGASHPGRNELIKQSKRPVERLQRIRARSAANLEKLKHKKANEKLLREEAIKDATEAQKLRGQQAAARVQRGGQSRISDTKAAGKAREKELLAGELKQRNMVIQANQKAFQEEVLTKSLSPSMSDEILEKLFTAKDNQQVVKILNGWWPTEGFSAFKGRDYDVDPEQLGTALWRTAEEGGLDDAGEQMVREALEEAFAGIKAGNNSGEAIFAARNAMAKAANRLGKSSDDRSIASQRSRAMRDSVHALDNYITSQMPKAMAKDFATEKTAYQTYINLTDAVAAASVPAGRLGDYTPSEWLSVVKRSGTKKFAEGSAQLQKEADATAKRIADQEAAIKGTTAKLITNLQEEVGDSITKMRVDLATKAERVQNMALSEKHVNRSADVRRKIAFAENLDASTKTIQGQLDTLDDMIKVLKDASPSHDSWFLQYAATGFLGAAALAVGTGVAGAGATIAAGMGASKVLATEGAQKVLAGQTATQEALNRVIQEWAPIIAQIQSSTNRATVMGNNVGDE